MSYCIDNINYQHFIVQFVDYFLKKSVGFLTCKMLFQKKSA